MDFSFKKFAVKKCIDIPQMLEETLINVILFIFKVDKLQLIDGVDNEAKY